MIKNCKRCKYQFKYELDVKHSKQEQKIIIKKIPICEKCGYKNYSRLLNLEYVLNENNCKKLNININLIKREHNKI
jgi:hypothetical protein